MRATAPGVHLVVEIAAVRPTVLRAIRLCAETVVIPTLLMAVLLRTSGLVAAVGSALGWCALSVAVRWVSERRLPGTLLLCAGVLSTRACVALATSSALIYMMQPVLGSCLMAALFLGSALFGRPITERLARDFVALPPEVLNRRGVRRLFSEVAVVWGLSRLADAGMNFGFLRWGIEQALLSRGLLSPLLTALTVLFCTWWGVRRFRREGIRLKVARAAVA